MTEKTKKTGQEHPDTTYLHTFAERRGDLRKVPNSPIAVAISTAKPAARKMPQHEILAYLLTEAEIPCQLIDLSESGLKIRARSGLGAGKEVNLYFVVQNPLSKKGQQVAIVPTCEVVWQNESEAIPGFRCLAGLQIKYLSAKQRRIYNAFVATLPNLPPQS